MAGRNIQYGVLLTGDHRGAVRSMRMTRGEARQLEREVRNTGQSADRTNKRFKAWAGSMNTLRGAIGPLVGAAGLGLLGRMTTQTLDSVSALQQQAETAGIGVERFQELTKGFADFANIAEGRTADALRDFTQRLGEARQGGGEAAEAFEAMGVNLDQRAGPALDATLRRLAEVENQSRRSALASQAFGEEAGPEIAAAMGRGHDALEDVIVSLRESDRIMSEDMVEAADRI